MKATELIEKLAKIIRENGDLLVTVGSDNGKEVRIWPTVNVEPAANGKIVVIR